MDQRRMRVVVSGRVQGVGYRYWARHTAEEKGVGGWVRNLADGRVEAELRGNAPSVDAMIEWMRSGPPGAVVDDVALETLDVSGADAGGPAAGFEIRR